MPPEDAIPCAIARWQEDLSQAAGHASVAAFTESSDETLDLAYAHPTGLAQFLAGSPTKLSSLFRQPSALITARRRTRNLRAASEQLVTRHGLVAVHVVCGVARWTRPSTQTTTQMPVLLHPVTLGVCGGDQPDDELQMHGLPVVNPALVQALAQDGVVVAEQELLEQAFAGAGFDPHPVYDYLQGHMVEQLTRQGSRHNTEPVAPTQAATAVGQAPGDGAGASKLADAAGANDDPAVVEHTIIGLFFDGVPRLAEALAEAADDIAAAPALADLAARELTRDEDGDVAPTDLTEPPTVVGHVPEDELCVPLDVDQQSALVAVRDGHNIRVVAPPGAGGTQLLTQLLCDAIMADQSMLVVSPRPRELIDVMVRADRLGISAAVYDSAGVTSASRAENRSSFQGADSRLGATARRFLAKGGHGAVRQAEVTAQVRPPSSAALLFDVIDRRHAMYRKVEPWGVSVADALDKLTSLTRSSRAPSTQVRFGAETMLDLHGDTNDKIRDLLVDFSKQEGFSSQARRSPWWAAMCASVAEAQAALQAARRLAEGPLRNYTEQVSALAGRVGLVRPETLGECRQTLDLLLSVQQTLAYFVDELYQRPIDNLVAATATSKWRSEHGVTMGLGERRRWRRQVKSFLRPGASLPDLHDVLATAMGERRLWQHLARSGGWPQDAGNMTAIKQVEQDVLTDMDILEMALTTTPKGAGLYEVPLSELADRVESLACDEFQDELPEQVTLSGQLAAHGLGELLTDLGEREVAPENVLAEYDLCWWASVLHRLEEGASLPRLGVDGGELWGRARAFEHQDRLRQVQQRVADQGGPTCVLTTPLRLLSALEDGRFDMVVVVGAHSCAVPEGVLAMSSGTQFVVMGDPDGVRPRGLDEAIEAGPVRDSIMAATADTFGTMPLTRQHRMSTQLAALLPHQPRWAVAAPTNPVTLVPVYARPESRAVTGDGSVVAEREIKAVVRAVMEHLHNQSDESLAVVTLTRQHARHVADAVRQEAVHQGAARDWLARSAPEPFVVTDMFRCEDVVRDHVIVSLGITTSTDRPLATALQELDVPGADRAVGAVFSRSRRRTTVVSSASSDDIVELVDPTSVSVVLSNALAVAANPPKGPTAPPEGLSSLVNDYAGMLGGAGFDVIATGGAHGWPDLTVGKPGCLPVAVLTDARQVIALDGVEDVECDPVDTAAWVSDQLLVAGHLQRLGWQVVPVSLLDLYHNGLWAIRAVEEASAGRTASVVHIADAVPAPGRVDQTAHAESGRVQP